MPPYRQLGAIIRGRVESGELAPGAWLPAILAMAAEYQVSVPTVRKALDLLKSEGVVVGVPGYGTFIAE